MAMALDIDRLDGCDDLEVDGPLACAVPAYEDEEGGVENKQASGEEFANEIVKFEEESAPASHHTAEDDAPAPCGPTKNQAIKEEELTEEMLDASCGVCLSKVRQPSAVCYGLARRWFHAGWRGPRCFYCGTGLAIRLAYMQAPAIEAWLARDEQNVIEARMWSLAVISFYEEGITEITASMLVRRANLFYNYGPAAADALDNGHSQVHLLSEYMAANPNVDIRVNRYKVVQMVSKCIRRLGISVPAPITNGKSFEGIGTHLNMSKDVVTDDSQDLRLLEKLCEKPLPEGPPRLLDELGSSMKADIEEGGYGGESHHEEMGVEILVYPKGKYATHVRKNKEKVDSVLAACQTSTWAEAFNESKLRGLLRATGGLQSDAQSLEYPTLADVVKENVGLVNAYIAHACNYAQFCKDEKVANIAKMEQPLLQIDGMLKKRFGVSACLDSDLVVFQARAKFWRMATEGELSVAVKAIWPGPVEDFEGHVLESYIRIRENLSYVYFVVELHVLKALTLKIGRHWDDCEQDVASGAEKLRQSLQDCNDAVKADFYPTSFQESVKACLYLTQCGTPQHPPKPSDVAWALSVAEEMLKKKKDLFIQFNRSPIGAYVQKLAQEVVDRNAQDILGDASFQEMSRVTDKHTPEDLKMLTDTPTITSMHTEIPDCTTQLLSACNAWSKGRVEEMTPAIEAKCMAMQRMLWHVSAHSTLKVLQPLVSILQLQVEVNGKLLYVPIGGDAARIVDRTTFAQTCADEASSVTLATEDLRTRAKTTAASLDQAVVAIEKVLLSKNEASFTKGAAVIREHVAKCIVWGETVEAVAKAFLCLGILLKGCAVDAITSMRLYEEFMDTEAGRSAEDATFVKPAAEAMPWLRLYVEFCRCQAIVQQEPAYNIDEISQVCASPFGEDEVNCLRSFLVKGPMVKYLQEDVWQPHRNMLLAFVVNDLKIKATRGIDQEDASKLDPHGMLALLVQADLNELAAYGAKYFSPSAPDAEMAPHMKTVGLLKIVFKDTDTFDDGLVSEPLQLVEDGVKELPYNMLCHLLLVYGQMKTLMALCASCAVVLKSQPGMLFFEPKAGTKQEPNPPSGVNPEYSQLLDKSQGAIKSLDDQLNSNLASAADERQYGLRWPLSHCKQWRASMGIVLSKTALEYGSVISAKTQKAAEDLEDSCPRWSSVFMGTDLDEGQINLRVIGHPQRPMIRPLIKFVRDGVRKLQLLISEWKLPQELLDVKKKLFAEGAIQTGEQFLIIVAAANIALHPTAAKAQDSAGDVLQMAKAAASAPESTFSLPPVLGSKLQEISSGSVSGAVVRATKVKSCVGTKVGGMEATSGTAVKETQDVKEELNAKVEKTEDEDKQLSLVKTQSPVKLSSKPPQCDPQTLASSPSGAAKTEPPHKKQKVSPGGAPGRGRGRGRGRR